MNLIFFPEKKIDKNMEHQLNQRVRDIKRASVEIANVYNKYYWFSNGCTERNEPKDIL